MNDDIEKFCNCSLTCLKNKSRTERKERLVPIDLTNKPRNVVFFDVAYLPWSSDHHRYFLILVDNFSKSTDLIPMPNEEAETIANAVATGWIYRHGPPMIMINYQAPNVGGDKIRDLLARFGIEKRHSSPYHSQGDGQAERGIRTTKQVMRRVLTERNIERNSWSTLLPEINYIINSVPNSSTKYTPFKVFYGTDPKLLSTAYHEN